ncbi:MAG: ribonuclease Y [Candidatus Omnitrophica bacterium]|nr:ribonuclease Y [Candidatus Omnitrophota bacterium]
MNTLYMIFISLIAGGAIGYFTKDIVERNKLLRVKEEAERFLREAKDKAQEIIRKADLDGKELLYKLRLDFEKRTTQKKDELAQLERRLSQREENLEKRLDFIESKEREISKKEAQINTLMQELTTKNNHLKQLIQEEKDKLQKISSLTPEEAKNLLLKMFSEELRTEKAIMLKQLEEEIKEEADKKAKEIISLAIQRCAVEHTTETTVSVVQLPNEEVKGRIIGREGRNIRAFEMVTGVDLVIDDTPEAVSISSFDPIRREIARIALEKLVMDGRIHPARIEEVIEKVKKDFERQLVEEGKAVAFELGIHNLHYEIIKLLGKLKYRTSFGQNALQHSKEVAFIMGILAGELGLDPRIAKRAGLLHDIGKAVDHQVEGTHSNIGGELLRKYGENEIVINTAESHHEEAEFKSIYSVLALVSDAISASRPGARRETLENYIKRLRDLESIATNFEGVEKAFAIQAGREIRVIVQPNKVKDEDMHLLAYQIKKSVEKDMEYPGQIKITVIRETRTVDYAK